MCLSFIHCNIAKCKPLKTGSSSEVLFLHILKVQASNQIDLVLILIQNGSGLYSYMFLWVFFFFVSAYVRKYFKYFQIKNGHHEGNCLWDVIFHGAVPCKKIVCLYGDAQKCTADIHELKRIEQTCIQKKVINVGRNITSVLVMKNEYRIFWILFFGTGRETLSF